VIGARPNIPNAVLISGHIGDPEESLNFGEQNITTPFSGQPPVAEQKPKVFQRNSVPTEGPVMKAET